MAIDCVLIKMRVQVHQGYQLAVVTDLTISMRLGTDLSADGWHLPQGYRVFLTKHEGVIHV